MKSTTYGQKDGEGPTRGKTAVTYKATLPDGRVAVRKSFTDHGPTSPASALEINGKLRLCVWGDGRIPWEGDFGPLTAERQK